MNHIGTNSIETTRLILRRFEPDDCYDMFKNWAGDVETLKYLHWGPHRNVSATRRCILNWIANYRYPNVYNWAIYLKSAGEVIGSISVEISDDKEESCEVGYCIGRAYWGREIMPEALRAVMHYLFYEVGYKKIVARYDLLNKASGRVMEKAGMKLDRIIYNAGRRRDGQLYNAAVYVKYRDDEQQGL